MKKTSKPIVVLILFVLLISGLSAKAIDMKKFAFSDIEDEFFDSFNQAMNANAQRVAENNQYPINGVAVASTCNIFIDSNARLGNQGAYAINEIVNHSAKYPSLLSNSALNEQCPNYRNLDVQQRA